MLASYLPISYFYNYHLLLSMHTAHIGSYSGSLTTVVVVTTQKNYLRVSNVTHIQY